MENNTYILGEIATIHTVMTFRDKAPVYATNGNAFAVTIKDLVNAAGLIIQNLAAINVEEEVFSQQILPGDILIPARGEYYFARTFFGNVAPTFPVGQINVIRPKKGLNSVYLSWYLNQDHVQHLIKSSLSGTGIKTLLKSKLITYPVILPDQSTQKIICDLQMMQAERSSLLREMLALDEKDINASCLKLIGAE